MTAAEIVAAVQEALARSGGMDVVYVHDTDGAMVAAIVRVPSEPFNDLRHREAEYEHGMLPHDHIEPGMF